MYPESIEVLINNLKKLPGIGKKTAERLALEMVYWDDFDLEKFAESVGHLKTNLHFCEVCGNFANGPKCVICINTARDHKSICVVEQPTQISILEQSGIYRGYYHVLGGKLKPLDGIGPEELNIDKLIQRAKGADVEEVILALSFDVEGEATASYLVEELKPFVEVSRLATGIPLGTDISYADTGTLTAAINRRYKM